MNAPDLTPVPQLGRKVFILGELVLDFHEPQLYPAGAGVIQRELGGAVARSRV